MPVNEDNFAEAFLATYNWNNPSYIALHEVTVGLLMKKFNPKSIIDWGCGIGVTVVPFLKCKVDAYGYDPNLELRSHFVQHFPQWVDRFLFDQDKAMEREYDMFFTCEVFEHLTDEQITYVMERIKCKRIVFSSTPHKTTSEGDAAWGHINIKNVVEWSNLFGKWGWKYEIPLSMPTTWSFSMVKW